MYGVIGEDQSDASVIRELIRKVAGNPTLTVKTKGYEGCAQMLRKGAIQINQFVRAGLSRFVIAYDSDGQNPEERRLEVLKRIVHPSDAAKEDCCIVIPVQEIEAWILADIEVVSNVITSWQPERIDADPESIASPKEFLERMSRIRNKRPVYEHTTHNEKVAKYLRVDVLRARCPSFNVLSDFVTKAF